MRVAITKTYDELIMPHSGPRSFWEVSHRGFSTRPPAVCYKIVQILYDVDIWAIVLANSLQDIPFLLVSAYSFYNQVG